MTKPSFEWDARKDAENQAKHGIPFAMAQYAFADARRVIAEDTAHSSKEKVLLLLRACWRRRTDVRFTYRAGVIRICGAGYWRKGKAIYERENQVHE
jgi:uncharacterized DUF497 family protein